MPHGGRAPTRDPSAADVVATTNTLNYALGNLGGKQKSWMSAGQSTSPDQNSAPPIIKRKPGRPRKPRPEELLQRAPPFPSCSRRQQTASNSTSPQLANVVSLQSKDHIRPSPTPVLPSPSPSEEAMVDNVLTLSNQSAAPNAYVPLRDASLDLGLTQGQQQATKRPGDADATEPLKRSRVGSIIQREQPNPPPSSIRVPLSMQQQPDPVRRASSGQVQSDSLLVNPIHMSNSSLGRQQQQAQSPYLQDVTLSGMHTSPLVQSQASTTPPQTQAPFGPPQSLSRGIVEQPFGTPEHRSIVNDSNSHSGAHNSLDGAKWYTQQHCFEMLSSFSATHDFPPTHTRDWKRLDVLKDAVRGKDWPYLSLHQYYCLLSTNPLALPVIFRNHVNLPHATRLLHGVLGSNETLSPAVLRFFAEFPHPLAHLAAMYPQGCQYEAQWFLQFILRSAHSDSLDTICERRNFPPLMRELVCDLGILSVVFQRTVFVAALRRLSSKWGALAPATQYQFEQQAGSIHLANQSDYLQRIAKLPKHQLQTFEDERCERELEMHQWGEQLKQLCGHYKQTLGLNAETSLLPSQQPPRTAQHPHAQTHHRSQSSTRQTLAQTMSSHSAQAAVQRGRGRGRPRLYPQQTRPQPPVTNPRTTRPSLSTPLLPRPGWLQPQQRQPNPSRFSLHQAHLRSPLLQAESKEATLYRHVTDFIKAPVQLSDAGHKIEKWTFTLTSEDLKRIPKDIAATAGAPPTRIVDEKSMLLRVRCVKWASPALVDEHTWATTDTSWIPYSYFTFNGTNLQQRKKLHQGKDLPMDISALTREGENTLEIAVMRQRTDERYRKYLVAIEVVGIKSHSAVISCCQTTNHVSAFTTKARIKQNLSGGTDDHEIAIVESNLSINLFDPFSASKICDIPARGRSCLHFDCFDLETFLQTRKTKGDVTVVDAWKCPICNGDARPQHLVVDGFLEEVRQTLEQQGLHRTRAILVDQSGSWKPKAEVVDPNGVQDPDDESAPTSRQASAHAPVIDLSD